MDKADDWRVFRARLVAQEQAAAERLKQQQQNKKGSSSSSDDSSSSSNSKDSRLEHDDKQLAKQGQLGDLFAGAISSIFKGGNHHQHGDHQANKNKNKSKNNKNSDIFDGRSIGGLVSKEDMDSLPDPFASVEELPLYLNSGLTKGAGGMADVDVHRWAHEIPHVEPGCVLIANEKLGGVFHQTVVLVIDHHDATGSTGVVINRYE